MIRICIYNDYQCKMRYEKLVKASFIIMRRLQYVDIIVSFIIQCYAHDMFDVCSIFSPYIQHASAHPSFVIMLPIKHPPTITINTPPIYIFIVSYIIYMLYISLFHISPNLGFYIPTLSTRSLQFNVTYIYICHIHMIYTYVYVMHISYTCHIYVIQMS